MFNSLRQRRRKLTVEPLEARALLTTFLVNTLADNPLGIATDTDGYVSLREAIQAANNDTAFGDAPAGQGGDAITFDAALMNQTIVLGGEQLTISGDLSLTGLGANSLTVSGDEASRIFSVEAGVTATIEQLSIVDGVAAVGGGIYNAGTLHVDHAAFARNSAGNGGAIALRSAGTLTVDNTHFWGNTAESTGGAIDSFGGFSGPYGTLEIMDSSFTDNSAGSGGAVWTDGGADVANSILSGNSARLWGGAIASSRNTLTISGSTVSDNDSQLYGGAIDNSSRGTVKITHSTLSGNSTGREGGAIENFGGTVEITNSTLSDNSSENHGGGIWSLGTLAITNTTLSHNRADADGDGSGLGGALYLAASSSFPMPVLNNTLVAGNLRGTVSGDGPDDIFGTLDVASSHNLIGDAATAGSLTHGVNGNIVGSAGVGTLDITTVLDLTLADNGGPTLTHALLPDGLAVNAGNNTLAVDASGNPLDHDQRGDGFARIVDLTVDIGSFELPPQPQVIDIDVKPGSDPNSINLASNGVIAVSILTTDDFDAALVDANTVQFADAHAVHHSLADIDGDGDLDMMLHFRVQDTNLAEIYAELLSEDSESNHQSLAVSLTGATLGGTSFTGSDGVDMFFAGKALRDLLNELELTGVL